MTATAPTERDTRPARTEAAYLHLTDFMRGQRVLVTGPAFAQAGVITRPLGDVGDSGRIEYAHLTVTRPADNEDDDTVIRVGVLALLSGRLTITPFADAANGKCARFDHANYATLNPAA
jgi:hypothetical protein